MPLRMRDELKSFMDVTPEADSPTYELIGEGFTDATTALNPNKYDRHYIHERTGQSDVIGYQPAISYSADMNDDDPVLKHLWKVGNKRLVGKDATTTIVTVQYWEQGSTEGTFAAFKQKVAIVPDNPGSGTAGNPLALTGSFAFKGDAVEGEWNDETKTFTPKAS